MNENYESLMLCNQLCFPVYACAKEIGRKIEEKYGWTVENNEYTYLTIHIARLLR